MSGRDTLEMLSAAGLFAQGAAEQRAANANARGLEANAAMAKNSAFYEEALARNANEQEIGRQIAAAGQAGATGSAFEVIRQNAVNAEMDALAVRYRGDIERAGYLSQAQAARREGKNAMTSRATAAGTSYLLNEMRRRSGGLRVT